MSVLGDVRQRLSKNGEELVSKEVVDGGIDRPVEADDWFEPETSR